MKIHLIICIPFLCLIACNKEPKEIYFKLDQDFWDTQKWNQSVDYYGLVFKTDSGNITLPEFSLPDSTLELDFQLSHRAKFVKKISSSTLKKNLIELKSIDNTNEFAINSGGCTHFNYILLVLEENRIIAFVHVRKDYWCVSASVYPYSKNFYFLTEDQFNLILEVIEHPSIIKSEK